MEGDVVLQIVVLGSFPLIIVGLKVLSWYYGKKSKTSEKNSEE